MPERKTKWKFVGDYPLVEYQCGDRAGDRIRLRREIIVRNHEGKPTGEVYRAGEIWTILGGSTEPPVVLWLRQADGRRHTWDEDDGFWEWFEKVEEGEP
ncbi:hypothetical protein [Pedosphaera parvula]|uniref:Uncharacterized protein n=1 Tax=Pedosphaera parvula (strain Ellin514) TaxID=320771 RepID=B9XL00_PEDPL|nr:hypothetical protein [Pedosphaera parvula]EEF59494.1 hypothetical protein Cflav_PD2338 [Pedosphaera parvula Ellin514]